MDSLKNSVNFSQVAFRFLQSSKQALDLRNPCNTQTLYSSYSQALVFLPHQSILHSFSLENLKGFFLLTGHVVIRSDTSVTIHTLIFSSQLFTLPRTYCALQVILLTADVDYGPKAQVMLPKEFRTPNNITCFFLYPEMHVICFEQLMISRKITQASSFHEIA